MLDRVFISKPLPLWRSCRRDSLLSLLASSTRAHPACLSLPIMRQPSVCLASWSGKERSNHGVDEPVEDQMEHARQLQEERMTADEAYKIQNDTSNPSSWDDPIAFRPMGSNSEEIIAADRSAVDPLQRVRQHKAHTTSQARQEQSMGQSQSPSQSKKQSQGQAAAQRQYREEAAQSASQLLHQVADSPDKPSTGP